MEKDNYGVPTVNVPTPPVQPRNNPVPIPSPVKPGNIGYGQ